MDKLPFDRNLLIQFEEHLNPRDPESCHVPVKVLGFGEITTVLEIGTTYEEKAFAFKRMPLFQSDEEITAYIELYHEYNETLGKRGIQVPDYDTFYMKAPSSSQYIFYGIQRKVAYPSIGNRVIHLVSKDEVGLFLQKILHKLKTVYTENKQNQGTYEIAIDGQISNWAVLGLDPLAPVIRPDMDVVYIDTSTPLIQKNGKEQLNPELFLRCAPSFMVWLIRKFFLQDVMSRYYNFRLVMIDIIANFYKEQREDLIPYSIKIMNQFIQDELEDFKIGPITQKEVQKYYKEDAFIWKFYLAARKVDRSLHRFFRKHYPYILPKAIKR